MAIKFVGVIGAGTMGRGIAQACATAGLFVTIVDSSSDALKAGLASIASNMDRLVAKDLLSPGARSAAMGRIRATMSLGDMADADIVIEAATENEQLKLKLLRDAEAVMRPEAILASNTSSISITRLATAVKRPDQFIGMHFFNPVPMMALVELIRGLQTSDATHVLVEDLARQLGKTPITVRNSPGFAVNRILCPMINEAIFVLAEGLASAEDIDAGMKLGCNQPIGPLALADLIGLDTLLAILQVLHDGFNDSKYRPAPLLKELVAAGHFGRKSGRGFYSYK